jgi:hypothetical protein
MSSRIVTDKGIEKLLKGQVDFEAGGGL